MPHPRHFPADYRAALTQKVHALRKRGLSHHDIGELLGVSHKAAWRYDLSRPLFCVVTRILSDGSAWVVRTDGLTRGLRDV